LLIFFFSTTGPAGEGDAEKVAAMLKARIESVLKVLENQDLTEPEQKKRIMELVSPVIDFELMAKLTLGKSNWGRLSETEQERFIDLFVKRLKASYLDKTTLYSGQTVSYQQGRRSGGKVYVPMEIQARDKTVSVLYKFYPDGAQWKVYDVEINGVSLIRSYRSQFTEILANGTVRDLFEELEEPGSQ
jgi:phospholipid transport system substrate-binding protein